nr:Chain T, TGF-BETA-ACTIVATED KINASE 1 AND MAP3K7-BINDING PROTEIN 1 [Homo sapiens]5DIY_P Chain P, TGF-beta-activated kinase 1 and MAP3K7-binding protein 1 [Homo sapiens]5DIY_Q Chain Q, TGF-beta-activated kinase 1 and MAP3K7-binding protein 1 [Homo sapiens]5VVU_B Chain B, TAB1 peptide [Homo sapiens]5VVU_D Chain D, TAB1 peptide [Homo sapiens]
VPYSSAQ